MLKIDTVFSGGGMKAYSFIGVLESLEERDIKIVRTAGTSAGAIISTLVAANYTAHEIKHFLMTLHAKKLLDAPRLTTVLPFSKWMYLYFQMGFYRGHTLEKWLAKKIAHKNIYTFNDIQQGHLKIIVVDLTLQKVIVIPDDLQKVYQINPNTFSVAKAARISAGFPLFFMPYRLKSKKYVRTSYMVDGGVVSNFPMWVFQQTHQLSKRPVLGIKITGNENRKNIKNIFHFTESLLHMMNQSYDDYFIEQYEKDIIFIPVQKVETMDLSMNNIKKKELITLGKTTAEQFLNKWPN